LLQNNALALFLSSNTTYLLQPVDNLVFSKFKGVISRHQDHINKVNKLHNESINNVTKNIIPEAEKQAFKKSIIKKFWTSKGLWPPSFERIHELVQEQCDEVDLKRISIENKRLVPKINKFLNNMLCSIFFLHKESKI